MRLPIDALQTDWEHELGSARLDARFRVWQTKKPVLARFADPAAVVSFARGSSSRADKDAVLGALLMWARHEAIGARMVLEIIRPGLLNLSARIMRDSRVREELCSMMFLAVWEAIRNYPLARRLAVSQQISYSTRCVRHSFRAELRAPGERHGPLRAPKTGMAR